MFFLSPRQHNELLDRFLNAEVIPDEQIIDLSPNTEPLKNEEIYEISETEISEN